MIKNILKEYLVLEQWLDNDCSVKRMAENTVRNETLKHPSVTNIKFHIVQAVDALYKENRNYFDTLFVKKGKGRFYKCFDLAQYGRYAPVIAYVGKRHYCYRIYKYRFGLHQNSIEGSRLHFDSPMSFIRDALLNKGGTLPVSLGAEAFFNSIPELAYRISQANGDLLVRGNVVCGIKSFDSLCNLCLYNTKHLQAHKDEVFDFFVQNTHKGYEDLASDNIRDKLMKKTASPA